MFQGIIDLIIGRHVIEIKDARTDDVYYVKYQKHAPPTFTKKKDSATRFHGRNAAKDVVDVIKFYGWLPKQVKKYQATIKIKRALPRKKARRT